MADIEHAGEINPPEINTETPLYKGETTPDIQTDGYDIIKICKYILGAGILCFFLYYFKDYFKDQEPLQTKDSNEELKQKKYEAREFLKTKSVNEITFLELIQHGSILVLHKTITLQSTQKTICENIIQELVKDPTDKIKIANKGSSFTINDILAMSKDGHWEGLDIDSHWLTIQFNKQGKYFEKLNNNDIEKDQENIKKEIIGYISRILVSYDAIKSHM